MQSLTAAGEGRQVVIRAEGRAQHVRLGGQERAEEFARRGPPKFHMPGWSEIAFTREQSVAILAEGYAPDTRPADRKAPNQGDHRVFFERDNYFSGRRDRGNLFQVVRSLDGSALNRSISARP